jgi:hypothetical protein
LFKQRLGVGALGVLDALEVEGVEMTASDLVGGLPLSNDVDGRRDVVAKRCAHLPYHPFPVVFFTSHRVSEQGQVGEFWEVGER